MIIETKGLERRFGNQEAVQSLDMAVPEGSIFALLGPNGAGKTTTIKMLMNILAPTGGEATVLGVDSRQLGPKEFQQIGYVSENQEMPEWMTVGEFIAYCRPMYPTWDNTLCERLLKQFQLPTNRKLQHLSRGMKMKASLLSSLAYRPQLLVLDEPFSGLDPLVRDEFVSGVLELAGESKWSILISSHDIEEVERLVDWIGFIDAGALYNCEPITSLQTRFRRIEIVIEDNALQREIASPPQVPPPQWLQLKIGAHSAQFVDSHYDPVKTSETIRAYFSNIGNIQENSMTLREIFVSLAQSNKLTHSK